VRSSSAWLSSFFGSVDLIEYVVDAGVAAFDFFAVADFAPGSEAADFAVELFG